ncbi:hypothetical protein HYDPIDRAFT_98211 [Hydnomerulius pinastri MD-312]|uniref:Protein PBN1 n=1 Tax=Hydnomerulius pinastri MD-312 TaxID=994086 RepID=A0A0C9VS48_9AGAM|nr:hypothetical protein HYDPIDRAFT_98211 [Hydnomerulius pinastri MD-312]
MSAPSIISHSLEPTRGFHSTLSTKIGLDYPAPECSVFALYALPPSIIIDRYELIDRNLVFEFWGESNLELPVFAVTQSSNSLLVNAIPADPRDTEVSVEIPVHARYGVPGISESTRQPIEIPPPTCFWACSASANASSAFSSEPPISSSAMLKNSTRFLVSEATSQSPTFLDVPLGSVNDLSAVEAGTAGVVLIAFVWLVHCSWTVAKTLHSHRLKHQ